MRFHEFTSEADNWQHRSAYPYLAEIHIDPLDWHHFSSLAEVNPGVRIIGHSAPQNGLLTVGVACASEEVRDRLHDAW
jgi:hypothetical protein